MLPSFNQEETNLISTVDRIRREVMTRVMEYLEHVEEKIENRGIDDHTVPYL
jgi:L-lactate utilization protein LutB